MTEGLPNTGVALLVAPNAIDAELALGFLREHAIAARAFQDVAEVLPEIDETAGCLVVLEEALVGDTLPGLRAKLLGMPAWYDLPVIIVSGNASQLESIYLEAFPESGNVTLLERPLNPYTLISAVQVALRAAARQCKVGELLEQRAQAVKQRDEFLAMLAHELRNPLAPIRNALHIMRMQNVDAAILRSSLDILDRQVHHIVHMLDDLMDVARLERGKIVLKKQRCDLNRVVGASVDICLASAQKRGHRIVVDFHAKALPVDADQVRIEQIVFNLINNAVKFTPAPGEIRVRTSMESAQALIVVQDNGIGFNADSADTLFEPFLQVNPTLERTSGGLGMGLTIVRRLAELHGGSVAASSRGSGKGARFVVRIPLANVDADRKCDHPRPIPQTRRYRIAVIEDNADIRETLRLLLSMWGHEVALASDGPTGVECVLSQHPDVALIDIGLPGMNGYEVARRIRQELRNGSIKLIAVTGYGQPSDQETAMQAGFDKHVLKPVEPELLARILAEIA